MIGFVATYAGGDVVIDREELEDARWFPCSELPRAAVPALDLEVHHRPLCPAGPRPHRSEASVTPGQP